MIIDKNSYGTILFAWFLCCVAIFFILRYVHPTTLSRSLAVILCFFMVFITWFFRVPDRKGVDDANAVTSVADGKVVIIQKVYEKEYLKRDCIQVSVYMNFFDVHANFWPVSGNVSYYQYHPGKYLLAFLPKSSEKNEHSSVAINLDDDEVFFRQIAGTFARRIVCYAKVGNQVERGKQCGVIKFGSRIDLFLPLDADIKVKIGDKVKACDSVIAELN
jgi:phosphatidylserine decarboxylase